MSGSAPLLDLGPTTLTGWGRTAPSTARLLAPQSPAAVADALAAPGPVLARGLGRSYGDAAQSHGGRVLDMTALARVLDFDESTGVLEVEAGASIDLLLRAFVPRGWIVAVLPGTRYVSVGGAIAADVHGKNHHLDGSFSRHVLELTLATPDGQVRTVSRTTDAELFHATCGAMGLTGVIVSARLQLRPVSSSRMVVRTRRVPDLDTLLALFADDDELPYSVAWVDTLARGRHLGRAVLGQGRHARADEVPDQVHPLTYQAHESVTVPRLVPGGLLNATTAAAFNTAWYHRAPRSPRTEVTSVPAYFHPLDAVAGWNRGYGPGGLVQYQFVVPLAAAQVVPDVLAALARRRVPVLLAVLKRFGPGDPGPLSFPMPGLTLAVDVPARHRGLAALLDDFDARVADVGGRVYLAKDSRLRPEFVPVMYPGLAALQQVRDRVDPVRRMRSDLSERLGL